MSVEWMLLAMVLALVLFPQSLAWLRAALFRLTDQVGGELKPSRIVFWIALFVAVWALSPLFVADIAWIAAIDVATYLEALAAVALAGAALRMDVVRRHVAGAAVRAVRAGAALTARLVRNARAVRAPRRVRKPSVGGVDDSEGWLAWA